MNDSIQPTQGFAAIDEQALFANLVSAQGIDLDQLEPIGTQVHTWQAATGTWVTFVQSRDQPVVDLVARFNAGTQLDGDTSGLAALTLHMLGHGTRHLDAERFAERIEQSGVRIDKRVRLTHATLSLRALSQQALLDPAIELFTEMLGYPALHATDLAVIKPRLLAYHAARKAHPGTRARLEAHAHLFAGHPYANASGSTAQGVESITEGDLGRFHQRAYSANNLRLSLVGDLSREQAESIVERITRALPQGWAAAQLPEAPFASGGTLHVDQAGMNSAVVLAMPIRITLADPDYPALMLAHVVLGSGFESRLMQELRLRRGLTYDISSELFPYEAGGVLSIDWEIDPQYVEGSQQLVASVLREFIERGPTKAELQHARQQVAGRLLRGVARNQSLAAVLVELNQQPFIQFDTYLHHLDEITPQAVQEVLQNHLDPTRMVFTSAGPATPQLPLPDVPAP
ncbi:putative zinc protease [Pseudomonas fluorescens]|uniref:M16 family metallopeptidase n=1 Tax=Pseudomonas fluorescens TaxID=294 RepID=UPI001253B245|nr:pitrilysin family protein [Pseudomonas fluorescens]CAG8864436.1 putative zinc protease [Pseudomonas fluorescens]VVP72933.1 putative zinc protease [Pseudomonas fluorescens]